jgi:glycosyltransferase involved in cell wall biosynthesis
VVVSTIGGLPEAVEGLTPQTVVPPGDPAALAECLEGPLPDRKACRDHAERYSWTRMVARHAELYERVVNARQTRALLVVYLDHSAKLSGAEIALLRLLQALDGVEAHVILAEEGPLVGQLLAAGISVEVLPLAVRAATLSRERVRSRALASRESLQTAGYALRLASRLRRLGPDLVHTNSLKAAFYGGLAGRLAGIPVVSHVHDRLADDYLNPGAARLVLLALGRLPAAVLAPSEAVAQTLGRPASVVPNVVPQWGSRNGSTSSASSFTVGMVGRVARWKGQDVFLDAFAQAFPNGDERARIVGAPLFGEDESRYLDELRGRVAARGLDDRVQFDGFVADVGAPLREIDVLVHASLTPEPFGLAVVEGMAAGLPVLAAGAGGPAEVITDGRDGLLYPPGDVTALAEKLRLLARDRDLRLRLGDAARARAAEFAPEAVAERMRAFYRDVLDGEVAAGSPAGVAA